MISARCRRWTSCWRFAEALPTGLYTGGGLERYVRDVLSEPGRSDDFRDLDVELYLTGTDLDSCERVVFGADGLDDVPISRAVTASCAVPMVYKPVEIKDRDLRRRRPRLDDQHRHRGRRGREVRGRRQPAGPVRRRHGRVGPLEPPGLEDGVPADRLPGVQAAGPSAPARTRPRLGGPLSRGRHHPDRTRPQRRADVPDRGDELHLTGRDRAARLRVGDAPSCRGLSALQADLRATRDRDLGGACTDRSSVTSRPSASRRGRGARSSSRRRRRCCVSRPLSSGASRRSGGAARLPRRSWRRTVLPRASAERLPAGRRRRSGAAAKELLSSACHLAL